MKKTKSFLWCFTVLLFVELIVVSNPDWYLYRILTKPLLVGSLLIFFLLQKTDKKTKTLIGIALFCAFIGDIQLIYAGDFEYLFIGGLIAFLCAKVIYIFEFFRKRDHSINSIVPLLILLLYAGSLYWYLFDSLGYLKVPVAIYMLVTSIMILCAYLRKDDMTDNGYIYVLTGALLLMLSASIVAITRFKSDIPFSRILVMAVHGIAHLSLIMGILMSDSLYKKSKAIV